MLFYLPTRVIFGSGVTKSVDNFLNTGEKVLLVTGKTGAKKSGALEIIKSLLKNKKCEYLHFNEVEEDPSKQTCDKIGELIKNFLPQKVISIGGGSVIDASKGALVYAYSNKNIKNYAGPEAKFDFNISIPHIAIPTTCGTGSEVTKISVITDKEKSEKFVLINEILYPQVAVVDPELINTLPELYFYSSTIDALTHAIEAFCNTEKSTKFSDLFAEKAINLIMDAWQDKAKEQFSLAATFAGVAINYTGGGFSHRLGHYFGVRAKIPHGLSVFMLLNLSLELNEKGKEKLKGEYQEKIFKFFDRVLSETKEFFRQYSVSRALINTTWKDFINGHPQYQNLNQMENKIQLALKQAGINIY